MSADKSFENTPNAPKYICPNSLPKPKSLGFFMKWVSVVRAINISKINVMQNIIYESLSFLKTNFLFSLL